MRTRTINASVRLMKVLCMVVLLALAFSVTGCGSGPFGLASDEDVKQVAAEKTWSEKVAASGAKKQAAPDETVLQYEEAAEQDAADPLGGDWSYPAMIFVPSGGKLYPDTEPHTTTILRQGDGYALKGVPGAEVTFDGTTVTIKSAPDQEIQSSFTGTLSGDTITGTRHHEAGGTAYDGEWIATRLK